MEFSVNALAILLIHGSLFRELAMRWNRRPLIILLGCCLATFSSASPQSGRRGLSKIVVPTQSDAADLRSQIRSGASFETVARAYSTDSTAVRAGYMGLMDESRLDKEFSAALKGLQPGAVSPVIRVGESFVLLKWATDDEDSWRSQYDSALAGVEQGRYPEAASLLLEAIRLAEKFGMEDVRLADSLNGLAQVYRYQQNYAEAEPPARRSLAILERTMGPLHKAVLPSLVNLAGIARAAGRYADAEQVYRRLLSIRWGTPDTTAVSADQVLEKLAEVLNLSHARDPGIEKALDEYWRLISESTLDKELYVRMRDMFMAVTLMPEAESLMQRAVRLHPGSQPLQFQLAEVYVTWGKYQKAIEILEQAARAVRDPDSPAERGQRSLFYATIAQMNFYLVRFDDAFAALTTALEINPDSTSSRLLGGALYLRRNRFDEAAAEYRRVLSLNPRVVDAHDGLAQVDLALGRYAEAVRNADKALEIDPAFQSSRYIKAMALIRDGRDSEGRAVLEEYQKREADRQIAESRLAEIRDFDLKSSALLNEKQPERAVELLRQGVRSHPLNAVLHRKLGLIQGRMGRHREAADTLESTVRLKPDDFLVHRQLSREYEALGNQEGARQQRVIYLQKYDAALQAKAN
jgi:tetratricopeptide (TPR) repeat protein